MIDEISYSIIKFNVPRIYQTCLRPCEWVYQLSGYSVIVWACVSVVQSGERSLPIVYFRRLLSDGCSFNCSISMVAGSNERLLKLIICWNFFNLELNSSSSRPTPLLCVCELLAAMCRKPRWRRDFGFLCDDGTTAATVAPSQVPFAAMPLLSLLFRGAVAAIGVLASVDTTSGFVSLGATAGASVASIFSSLVIWMVMMAVVFISC